MCNLIDGVEAGQRAADPESAATAVPLEQGLRAYLAAPKAQVDGSAVAGTSPPATPAGGAQQPTDAVQSTHWHLSLRFGPDVLKNGMDPISFLRYLQTMGRIEQLVTAVESMPEMTALDPETCYLGFELAYMTAGVNQWVATFDDVPVGGRLRIRVSDPNVCASSLTGAATQGVYANGVRLTDVVGTPGIGTEPGLAFTLAAGGAVTP